MKLVIKRIVATVVFVCILLGLITKAGFFVRPIDIDSDNMSYLYKEDKDSLNVVCMGSSAMYRFWIAQQAYEERHFTSSLVTNAGQEIDAVPYLMGEVEKTQNVDLFVVEVRSPISDEGYRIDDEFDEAVYLSRFSFLVMGMKQSLNRLKLINNVLKENAQNTKFEWMIPLLKYHDNMHKLTADQFVDRLNGVDKDEIYTKVTFHVNKQKAPVYEADDSITFPDHYKKSIDNIQKKADAVGAKVLFVSTPYIPNHSRAALQLQLSDYINQKGYDYLDMTDKIDEIGIDLDVDFYDENHANIGGAQKVTSYLAAYIADHYDLPDRLNKDQKARWEELCKTWDEKDKVKLIEKWQAEIEKGASDEKE